MCGNKSQDHTTEKQISGLEPMINTLNGWSMDWREREKKNSNKLKVQHFFKEVWIISRSKIQHVIFEYRECLKILSFHL